MYFLISQQKNYLCVYSQNPRFMTHVLFNHEWRFETYDVIYYTLTHYVASSHSASSLLSLCGFYEVSFSQCMNYFKFKTLTVPCPFVSKWKKNHFIIELKVIYFEEKPNGSIAWCIKLPIFTLQLIEKVGVFINTAKCKIQKILLNTFVYDFSACLPKTKSDFFKCFFGSSLLDQVEFSILFFLSSEF